MNKIYRIISCLLGPVIGAAAGAILLTFTFLLAIPLLGLPRNGAEAYDASVFMGIYGAVLGALSGATFVTFQQHKFRVAGWISTRGGSLFILVSFFLWDWPEMDLRVFIAGPFLPLVWAVLLLLSGIKIFKRR